MNALRARSKSLSLVVELYSENSTPPFDPAEAIFRFAQGGLSFAGEVYERYVAKNGIGGISKTFGKSISNFTLTLQNENAVISDIEDAVGFEGLICVVRCIDRGTSISLADSAVQFTGRCEAPDEFSRSSLTAKITVKQILNQTEVVVPRRKFTTSDPDGRAQSDLQFKGFIYTPRGGEVSYNDRVRRGGILGAFGLKKSVLRTKAYTSHSDVQEEMDVPIVLGRTQVELINFAYIDRGPWIEVLGFWCDGHEYGIADIQNDRSVTEGMALAAQLNKLGLQGGLVDDATHQANDDPNWIGAGVYAETAYKRYTCGGTTVESDDPAPTVVALIFGQKVLVPDGSGDFVTIDFSVNPVAQSRWLLSSPYYFNLPSPWHDDEENFTSYQYCKHVLVDFHNTDAVILAESENGIAGIDYRNYKSTGALSPVDYKYQLGAAEAVEAYSIQAEYQYYSEVPYNSDDPTGTGTPVLPNPSYRERFTSNLQLRDQMKGLDFLHDILHSSANLYMAQTAEGKIAHKIKKPVDFTFIYEESEISATEIHVKNINPWVGQETLILIGANLTNSEIRRVAGYRYDTSVSIGITASGGVSSSGASLSGGDDDTAPFATLTVSSTSGTKLITIGDFSLSYSSQSGETTATCAAFIAGMINSHEELNKFVKGTWNEDNTVTVSSRVGYLEMEAPLEFAHLPAIPDPTDANGLTETSGGNLAAGTYLYTYSFLTLEGETLTSPVTSITISADKKIETDEIVLPDRGIAVNHYISTEPNGVRRKLIATNDGSSFFINELPLADDQLEPAFNTTAEEIHHVAMSFADKGNTRANVSSSNMLKDSFDVTKSGTINQVEIAFRDASADYRLSKIAVQDKRKIAKAKKINSLKIDGSAIDNEHQARRIANSKLAEQADGNKISGLASDNEALLLEEGDVVAVSDSSVNWINKPVRIESIDVSNSDGYPSVKFKARIYSRLYYDDQVRERLVPLPIVQNSTINREQKKPNLYLMEDTTNTTIKVGVTDYRTIPNYRETWVSTDPLFADPEETYIILQSANNTVGEILDGFVNIVRGDTDIAEIDDLDEAVEVSIKSRHSSNGVKYGAWSVPLVASFEDDLGAGGSVATPPPPPDEGGGTGGAPPALTPILNLVYEESLDETTSNVRLNWTSRGGGGTYSVYYNTLATDNNFVASGLTGTSYLDTAARPSFGDPPETRYYFVVKSGVAGNSNDLAVDITPQSF